MVNDYICRTRYRTRDRAFTRLLNQAAEDTPPLDQPSPKRADGMGGKRAISEILALVHTI